MQDHTTGGNQKDVLNSSTQIAAMHTEMDVLRRRLAALEEKPRGQTNRGRSIRNAVAMLIAMAVLTVLANAPLVHGQSVVDALFISANGNVGIGTTNPASKLDVNGAINAKSINVPSVNSTGITTAKLDVNGAINATTVNAKIDGQGFEHSSADGKTKLTSWLNASQVNFGSSTNHKLVLVANNGSGTATLLPNGNFGIGKSIPVAKLDVAGDINVNNNRISSYRGFPTADFSEKVAAVLNQTWTFHPNFGTIPSLVQVWVRSDGKSDSSGITKTDQWKIAGILSLWEGGASYGTVVESIDENLIIVRTGNSGLWHGHIAGDFFTSGEVWVRAWK